MIGHFRSSDEIHVTMNKDSDQEKPKYYKSDNIESPFIYLFV